jgi:hypothetical protein
LLGKHSRKNTDGSTGRELAEMELINDTAKGKHCNAAEQCFEYGCGCCFAMPTPRSLMEIKPIKEECLAKHGDYL